MRAAALLGFVLSSALAGCSPDAPPGVVSAPMRPPIRSTPVGETPAASTAAAKPGTLTPRAARAGAATNPWSLRFDLTAPEPKANAMFGADIALSADGSTFAVRDDTRWLIYTSAPNGTPRRESLDAATFGRSGDLGMTAALSGDGNSFAVGGSAPCRDGETPSLNGNEIGAVVIFERRDNRWRFRTCIGNTDHPDHTNAIALSADGGTLAVAHAEHSKHEPKGRELDAVGSVDVFRKGVDGLWQRDARLEPDYPTIDGCFGTSIALNADGTTLAVGTPREPRLIDGEPGFRAGAAYVFVRTNDGWAKQGHVFPDIRPSSDVHDFGFAIALDAAGDTLAVTEPTLHTQAIVNGKASGWSGFVHTYSRSAGEWRRTAVLPVPAGENAFWFGAAVALAGDGKTLAIGATATRDFGPIPERRSVIFNTGGAGQVFVLGATAAGWETLARIDPPHPSWPDYFGSEDQFGHAVALSADARTLLVGAWLEDFRGTPPDTRPQNDVVTWAGAVYLFGR